MKATYINGQGPIFEAPSMCGACKFAINSNTRTSGGKSFCTLFQLKKNYYDSPPKRCQEMFRKALAIGGEVVIVNPD